MSLKKRYNLYERSITEEVFTDDPEYAEKNLVDENIRKTEPIKRSGRGFDDDFRRKGNKHSSKRR